MKFVVEAVVMPVPARLAATALLGIASCAPLPPPPVSTASLGQCFFGSTITGFKPSGPEAVTVRTAAAGVYRLDLAAPCGDLRAAEKVLIDSRAAGASVCTGADATLIVSSPAGGRTCPGRALRRLTEAEVAAIPAADRP